MVTVKVKTTWHGMVAIRDKYYQRAKVEGLTIRFFSQQMTLTPGEVASKIVMGSEAISDQFSNNTHRLLYYEWKPNQKEVLPQPKLL